MRPSLQWSLDAITSPAILDNNRQDLLAANLLGRAVYSDMRADPARPPNFARFIFLDSAARRFYPDWDLAAEPDSPTAHALTLLASWAVTEGIGRSTPVR